VDAAARHPGAPGLPERPQHLRRRRGGRADTFAGPSARQPFPTTSPTRTYQRWADITTDNVDARVWSGIHTRTAGEAGVLLGKRVARYGLNRFWTLVD
jgi:hypothetical protein